MPTGGIVTIEGAYTVHKFIRNTSFYPVQDTDHVKATTTYGSYWQPWFATDPSRSLTGSADDNNTWTASSVAPNRFHIDLGSSKVINTIYHEGSHHYGNNTSFGVRNFTLWGTNDVNAFNELSYSIDTGWTQLSTDITEFAQHYAANMSDPHYIKVTGSVAYRYYAFKFADNWGGILMQLRRVELQEGTVLPTGSTFLPSDYGPDLLGSQISDSFPYAVSASSTYDSSTQAYKAFDSTIVGTWWANNYDLPCWLAADFGVGNAKVVQKYTIYSSVLIAYRPDSWTFEGSNDNSNWDVLDTQTGQLFLEGVLEYAFSNAVAYRYYRIHITVVGPDGRIGIHSLTMHEALAPAISEVEVLVVAGGGGGGTWGGGGAGGYVHQDSYSISGIPIPITVGAGGIGGHFNGEPATSGEDSVFGTITAIGGGLGGGPAGKPAGIGGSGGGGDCTPSSGAAGTLEQGYAGGSGHAIPYNGGGGGGASAVGEDATDVVAGDGGAGIEFSISGSPVTYAGGGGGGAWPSSGGTPGIGGVGGGGNGSTSGDGQAGTHHTGGGGGARGDDTYAVGGNGGSGIVIVRYLNVVATEQTLEADSCIQITQEQTANSDSFCGEETGQTIDADASVCLISTQTIDADSFCGEETSRTILNDATIKAATSQFLNSNASIFGTIQRTVDSIANISGVTYQNVNAQAFIVQVRTQEVTSSAVIIVGEPNVKLFMVI